MILKIKIHTDFKELVRYPKPVIFPLIEYLNNKKSTLHQYYEITTLQNCDFAVLPLALDFYFNINQKKYVTSFIGAATKLNKKIIVFTANDIGKTIKNNLLITLRLGGFNDKFDKNTFIMSPFINDPYKFLNKEILYLDKKIFPEIGFVGHSNGSFIKIVKEFLLFLNANLKVFIGNNNVDYSTFYPSSYFRNKYLKIIMKDQTIKTNFIFRKKYRAGATNAETIFATTNDFFLNIYNNPYTFCMRGGGNFSVRLYETLAMGRIPVFINTNCRLPFINQIDWTKHCIIIDEKDSNQLNNKIIQFHSQFSKLEFITLQRSNRILWEKYFTKEHFFIQFQKELLHEI